MQTRVSRHKYDEDIENNSYRQRKNENLYKLDFTNDNIKVPKISNGRELDEEEFQKIINQSQTRSMKKITKEEIEKYEKEKEFDYKNDDKVYDINTVLESAKNRRGNIDSTKYNIPELGKYKPVENKDEKQDNNDLLSDLMGNDNTIVTKGFENNTLEDDTMSTKVDNSFYSKSMKFKKKDFALDDDDEDEDNSFKEKKSKFQIVVTIIIVLLLIAAVVLGILVLSKIKF